jgi:hypothetical protein
VRDPKLNTFRDTVAEYYTRVRNHSTATVH